MKSFYPKGNWVKWKSRIEESVESLIKWAFEKTVNKSWQNRWKSLSKIICYFSQKKKIRKIRQIFRHYYIQVKRNIKKIPLI